MSAPSHRWVAKKLGITIPMVSLIRSGKRRPSLGGMNNIEFIFGWKVSDQVQAVRDGKYQQEFNQMINDAYAESLEESNE